MNNVTATSKKTYEELAAENQRLINEKNELQATISQLARASLNAQQSNVKGLVFRTVCPFCAQWLELPPDAIKYAKDIGKGTNSDGSYDYGYSQTSLECTACKTTIKFRGDSIDTRIKNREIGFAQVYRP